MRSLIEDVPEQRNTRKLLSAVSGADLVRHTVREGSHTEKKTELLNFVSGSLRVFLLRTYCKIL